jgi:hypothetical protein
LKGTIDINEAVKLEKIGKTDIKITLTPAAGVAREALLRCPTEASQDEWHGVFEQVMAANEAGPQVDEEEEIIWAERTKAVEAEKAACTIPDTDEERMKLRPMIITVQSASGLTAEAAKKAINPLMMITVLGASVEDDDLAEGEEAYPEQITQVMTAAKKDDLNPEWNEVVTLPAVSGDMILLFTCVDFEGGSYTFLGQSCLRLQETGHWRQKEALTLNLAAVDDALPPRDGMGKPFEFDIASASGSGEFTVTLEPVDLNDGFFAEVKKCGGKAALDATKVCPYTLHIHTSYTHFIYTLHVHTSYTHFHTHLPSLPPSLLALTFLPSSPPSSLPPFPQPPSWKKRFIALANDTLACYEERSDPRPGLTLAMANGCSDVSRSNNVRECLSITHSGYDNEWDDNDDDTNDTVLNVMFASAEEGDHAYKVLRKAANLPEDATTGVSLAEADAALSSRLRKSSIVVSTS